MGSCQYQKSGICSARPPRASRARTTGEGANDDKVRCLEVLSLRLSRAASCGCDKPSPGRRACHTGAWRYPRTPCRTPGTSSYTRVARTRAVWPLLNARLPFREVRRPARRRSYRLMVCSVRALSLPKGSSRRLRATLQEPRVERHLTTSAIALFLEHL